MASATQRIGLAGYLSGKGRSRPPNKINSDGERPETTKPRPPSRRYRVEYRRIAAEFFNEADTTIRLFLRNQVGSGAGRNRALCRITYKRGEVTISHSLPGKVLLHARPCRGSHVRQLSGMLVGVP
jgi:hypothetical protein